MDFIKEAKEIIGESVQGYPEHEFEDLMRTTPFVSMKKPHTTWAEVGTFIIKEVLAHAYFLGQGKAPQYKKGKWTNKTVIPSSVSKSIEKIAKKVLRIETLETRNSDSLDFPEINVVDLIKSMELSFNEGIKARS